ncbi:MAG: bifunctional nicotinamidase/pyrazinamidase [Legionella sp.]|nr:bifunctional nicotinamidase/pyrazinamidase [Legionella sp.]
MKALIILDLQNDFMSGGSLAVPQADQIVPMINQLQPKFDVVVATQDWHPKNHLSFAINHPGKKLFEVIKLNGIDQMLWPTHCVQGTLGADFYPTLETKQFSAIFRKGMDAQVDSYSGFYDNDHKKSTGLTGYLRELGAKTLYFCGLCAEVCVFYSMLDALQAGFDAALILDATAPFDSNRMPSIKEQLVKHGARLLQSSEL